jgi:tRNA C32,U32 (ribose-2'-O)-methylase TrmJ
MLRLGLRQSWSGNLKPGLANPCSRWKAKLIQGQEENGLKKSEVEAEQELHNFMQINPEYFSAATVIQLFW